MLLAPSARPLSRSTWSTRSGKGMKSTSTRTLHTQLRSLCNATTASLRWAQSSPVSQVAPGLRTRGGPSHQATKPLQGKRVRLPASCAASCSPLRLTTQFARSICSLGTPSSGPRNHDHHASHLSCTIYKTNKLIQQEASAGPLRVSLLQSARQCGCSGQKSAPSCTDYSPAFAARV